MNDTVALGSPIPFVDQDEGIFPFSYFSQSIVPRIPFFVELPVDVVAAALGALPGTR